MKRSEKGVVNLKQENIRNSAKLSQKLLFKVKKFFPSSIWFTWRALTEKAE